MNCFKSNNCNKNTCDKMEIEWCDDPPHWSKSSENTKILLSDGVTEESSITKTTSVEEIIQNSSSFPVKFPTETNRCQYLKTKFPHEILEANVNSTYPLIHEKALYLCSLFLVHKRKSGTTIEKSFYKNLTLLDLIDRLLSKRAVVFVGARDYYRLLDGSTGFGNWDSIGKPHEKLPLVLKNCLSYDEIKLAALIGVSSYSVFVNDGNRSNGGKFEAEREKIEDCGVIVGLVGTRLVRYFMEYQEIVKSREQNTQENGYGKKDSTQVKGLFLEFYGDKNKPFGDLKKDRYFDDEGRFVKLLEDVFFDKLVYERRISLSIDTLLIEANERAKREDKMAFVHVVGLGLGVWKIWKDQDKTYMDTFYKRIKSLSAVLQNTSDICFAYIKHPSLADLKDGDKFLIDGHRFGGINIHIRNREPHTKLQDEGKLLVVSYAWDGNALPGNEYWEGNLWTSSDPAAACSTQVSELHNPHINKEKVAAKNLRVVTLSSGILSIKEYQEKVQKEAH